MNWLALSPAEVAAVWAVLAGVALWLYLHHRIPQHKIVSTLRFWTSVQPVTQPRRRTLREPWALLAQVLFLLLIVLALANPRWRDLFANRSVAIVLDASIWSQAHPAGESSWIEQERAEAIQTIDSLPAGDRVLLLRTEAGAPPVAAFSADHAALRRAIESVQPSSAPADIPRALELARAAVAGSSRNLVIYVGPGLLDEDQARRLEDFRAGLETASERSGTPRLLVRLAPAEANVENRGITRLSLRRDAERPDRWRLLAQLKNYGAEKATGVLKYSIDGRQIGERPVALAPGQLATEEEEFTWEKGGLLEAKIEPEDALSADDRAVVAIPSFRTIRVAVFLNHELRFAPKLLSVLGSNPYVQAAIVPPGAAPSVPPDVAIYQGPNLPSESPFPSIWFLSGPAKSNAKPLRIVQWNAQHAVTRWVRTHDVSIRNPAPIPVRSGDAVLAYTEGNPPSPLIVAREQNGRRMLILGFDPQDSNFTMESAFPLLMAGGIEWMTHLVEESVESVSTGELDVPGPVTRVVRPSGKDLPFARKGSEAHILALETGVYRVMVPGGETSLAVNAPLLPTIQATPTLRETAGIAPEPLRPDHWDLWRWLVLLAMIALWAEWKIYYWTRERSRAAGVRAIPAAGPPREMPAGLDAKTEGAFRDADIFRKIS